MARFFGSLGESTSIFFSSCHSFKIESMIYTDIFVVGNLNVAKVFPIDI